MNTVGGGGGGGLMRSFLRNGIRGNVLCSFSLSFTQVENIIMLDEYYADWTMQQELEKYQKEATCDPLLVTILLRPRYVVCPSEK